MKQLLLIYSYFKTCRKRVGSICEKVGKTNICPEGLVVSQRNASSRGVFRTKCGCDSGSLAQCAPAIWTSE
jgi:hypothetical protein